jgi:hypothetical protein
MFYLIEFTEDEKAMNKLKYTLSGCPNMTGIDCCIFLVPRTEKWKSIFPKNKWVIYVQEDLDREYKKYNKYYNFTKLQGVKSFTQLDLVMPEDFCCEDEYVYNFLKDIFDNPPPAQQQNQWIPNEDCFYLKETKNIFQ